MTNLQILQEECATRGITEEVHTFAKWKSLGYKVKQGEKALFNTMLWKHSTKVVKNDEDEEEKKTSMYMTKAFLFGRHQVEKIGGNKDED
jgi:hypothetical protein